MILQALAATNFLLGSYDAWLTRKRMKAFGVNFELNGLIKFLSHLLGPDLASVIGVLGPCVGWTFIFCYFNLPVALAIMIGYGLKRFEIQLQSRVFEKNALKIQKMMNEFRASESHPPFHEPTSSEARENSNDK